MTTAVGGEFTISKERWAELDEKERSWIMYDSFIQHRHVCHERFCKLERRKWWDKAVAVISGAAAGIASAVGVNLRQ